MSERERYDIYRPVPQPRFGPLFSPRVGSVRLIFWAVASLMAVTASGFLLLWLDAGPVFFAEDGLGRTLAGPTVALFGAGLAALLKLYDTSHQRLGRIDSVLHEMIGICRLIYTTNLVGALRALCFLPAAAVPDEGAAGEDYTVAYDSNLKDLGFLGPNELNAIVTFYTALKGARDARTALRSWPALDARRSDLPPGFVEQRKDWDVVSVVYCLFIAFENAYDAVGALADSDDQRRQYQDFLMTEMCDCYVFLLDAVPEWDRRRNWLRNARRRRLFGGDNAQFQQSCAYYEEVKAALKSAYPDHFRPFGAPAGLGAGGATRTAQSPR